MLKILYSKKYVCVMLQSSYDHYSHNGFKIHYFFQRVTQFLQIRDCSIRIAQVNLTALIERLIALLEYIYLV